MFFDINKLKRFAQEARRYLREMVSGRLQIVLTDNSLAQRENPKAVADLKDQIKEKGLDSVIDFVAYTWFNRLCALRYMDIMDYNTPRIVSPADGHIQPEILEEAKSGNPGDFLMEMFPVKTARVRGLLDGSITADNAQEEAYHILLVSACNALYKPMPFLFQKIDDYTELLMPDQLLKDGSILSSIRNAIPDRLKVEENSTIEVIGWLYQFYISEKKDEVMGKTVKTEDIPAATQLFTPHWIVRYLVENSLGRLWMLNHPGSRLAENMEYYIAPDDEHTADFLKVPSPEELKICDPCCGSGHMLTYAFDLLVKIYDEQGIGRRDAVNAILEKNLCGIEIDPRAGELAAFALAMKAREYYPRYLSRQDSVQPHICVLRNISFDPQDLTDYVNYIGNDLFSLPLQKTLRQFDKADCFGSLIVPGITDSASVLAELEEKNVEDNLLLLPIHKKVCALIRQAEYLTQRYHLVVTNPPYMGGKGMNADLKEFAEAKYPDSKSDLFAMFIERCLELVLPHGITGMITMQSWMFLSSYEKLRTRLLDEDTILTMLHLGPRAFDSIGGEVVQTTAFTLTNTCIPDYKGVFLRLVDGNSEAEKAQMFQEAIR